MQNEKVIEALKLRKVLKETKNPHIKQSLIQRYHNSLKELTPQELDEFNQGMLTTTVWVATY